MRKANQKFLCLTFCVWVRAGAGILYSIDMSLLVFYVLYFHGKIITFKTEITVLLFSVFIFFVSCSELQIFIKPFATTFVQNTNPLNVDVGFVATALYTLVRPHTWRERTKKKITCDYIQRNCIACLESFTAHIWLHHLRFPIDEHTK